MINKLESVSVMFLIFSWNVQSVSLSLMQGIGTFSKCKIFCLLEFVIGLKLVFPPSSYFTGEDTLSWQGTNDGSFTMSSAYDSLSNYSFLCAAHEQVQGYFPALENLLTNSGRLKRHLTNDVSALVLPVITIVIFVGSPHLLFSGTLIVIKTSYKQRPCSSMEFQHHRKHKAGLHLMLSSGRRSSDSRL